MTPIQITVLLHYYSQTDDYYGGDVEPPSVRNAIEFLRKEAMLTENMSDTGLGPQDKITDRGRCFVEAMKALPLPVQTWVMPERN